MTIDELLATAPTAVGATDELLVIDPDTRQINLPSVELIFGVEFDAQAERKYFYCPRYVGNGLDLASCVIRVNYRNANGTVDAYLVDDMSYTDDAIMFSWALHRNVTLYKGQVQFVVCCNRPGGNGVPAVEWNTTVTTGTVLAGLEPDGAAVEAATSDVISALLTKVDAQVANVTAEGAAQVQVVQAASEAAQAAVVAEIEAKGASTLATIPEDYTTVQNAVRGAANAIRKKVSGEVIRVDDVSPMEHYPVVKVACPEGVDPTTVTVRRCGKNIFGVAAKSQAQNGVTFTVNNDGTVSATGTATKATFIGLGSLVLKPGEKYRLSGSPAGSAFDTYVLYIHNNTTGADTYDMGEGRVFTGKEGDLGVTIAVYAGTTVNNLVFRPMVVLGENVEDFEPYGGENYIPPSDGTMSGLRAVSPTMTLMTDTPGVTIKCEYSRDTNKVVNEILEMITALTGVKE